MSCILYECNGNVQCIVLFKDAIPMGNVIALFTDAKAMRNVVCFTYTKAKSVAISAFAVQE